MNESTALGHGRHLSRRGILEAFNDRGLARAVGTDYQSQRSEELDCLRTLGTEGADALDLQFVEGGHGGGGGNRRATRDGAWKRNEWSERGGNGERGSGGRRACRVARPQLRREISISWHPREAAELNGRRAFRRQPEFDPETVSRLKCDVWSERSSVKLVR